MTARAVNDLLIDPILKGVFCRHRGSVIISIAERLDVHDLSILDNPESRTWHPKFIESLAHVAVDRIKVRAGLGWRRLGVPRRQSR